MRGGMKRKMTIVATLLAGIAAGIPAARAGDWTADAKSGCQVFNPSPQLEESVAWSGACANGRADGPGSAQWLRRGAVTETDEGTWRDGRQAGHGVQTWPGGRYEGDVADGAPNGRGVMTLKQMRYEGEFRDGKPNGAGTLTSGSNVVHGNWRDGCLEGGTGRVSIGVPLSACH
jgi:hypothetical protein